MILMSQPNFSTNVSIKVRPLTIFVVPTITSYAIPSCNPNINIINFQVLQDNELMIMMMSKDDSGNEQYVAQIHLKN